jgi:hypothetical protein
MNRKLQHTVQALTASVAVFGLLLLAGGPPTPDLPASVLPSPTVLMATADADQAGGESAMEATEATEAMDASGAGVRVQRSHRAALAMPYFSFAKGGLRHVTGS